MTAEEFREFRLGWGSRARVAEVCGVSERQVRRWESGASAVPPWTVQFLQMLSGNLGSIDRRWEQWRLVAHELCEPSGKAHSQHALYFRTFIDEIQRLRERDLRSRIEELEHELRAVQKRLREVTQGAEQLSLF